MRHLIFGGARSGKTRLALERAQRLADESGRSVTYVATAQPLDAEMTLRIQKHQAERPTAWRTIEAPTQLAAHLTEINPDEIVVVDCMTLWLTNLMLCDFDEASADATLPTLESERDALIQYLKGCSRTILLVSNEVGHGLVPDSRLGRRFRDDHGLLNQTLAAICERVTLVVAGLPVELKGTATDQRNVLAKPAKCAKQE